MTGMRDAEMYVLYAGLILFALNVFPLAAVRRVGARLAHMTQLRVPLPSFEGAPAANTPPARPRSMALLLLMGWVFAFLTIVSYGAWYRKYQHEGSDSHQAPPSNLGARWEYYFVKWRSERDLYIRASAAVAYLTLHVLVDCHVDAHRALEHAASPRAKQQ
jgi:hypothetical protein